MPGDSLEDVSLSLKQNVLLTTDGTVTDLIALLSGEPIHITKLRQQVVHGTGPEELQLEQATALLERAVLLSGRQHHYLYAESFFVVDRLPPGMQRELLETETPIGLLWKRARLEMYREMVERSLERRPDLLSFFPDARDERFLSRSYVVHHGRQPLGVITEKFPYSYFCD